MGHEDTYFTPEAVDEQIDRLRSDAYLATPPSADARMLHDLRALYQTDESRLEYIWGRLSTKAQQLNRDEKLPVDIQYYQQRKLQDPQPSSLVADADFLMDTADPVGGQWREPQDNDDLLGRDAATAKKKKSTVQRLGLVLTQLVAVLIIGSLLLVPAWTGSHQNGVVPNVSHQAQQDFASHSVYLSNEQGVMGVDTHNGQARWTYTVPNYALGLPVNPIVGNGIVYAESQDSVYAIDAATGARRWSHTFPSQLSPYQTNKARPVLSNNAIYVSVVFMEVDELDATTGRILRTYNPQLNTNIVSIAIENNILYAFGLFDMCALRLSDGKQLWYRTLNQSQVLGIPHIVNGTLYTITSSDTNWPYVDPKSTSRIEAFSAATGTPLWQSSLIHGSATDISIVNGMIYTGSTDGSVSAYDAKTGASIWSKTIVGMSFSGSIAPLIDANVIYMLAQDPTSSYQSVGIVALDLNDGHLSWQYPSDSTLMKRVGHKFNPPVAQNGVVFVNDSISGQNTSDLYALFAGAVLWHRTIDNKP